MAIHVHKSLDVFSAEGSSAEAAYVTKLRALSVSEKTNPQQDALRLGKGIWLG